MTMTEVEMEHELDELRRTVRELADKEAIREVLYTYTRHIDRLYPAGVKSAYFDDAEDLHFGAFVGNAHDFADYMIGELNDVEFVTHEVTNPLIELDGDRAFVESRYTSRVRIGVDGAPAGRWVESLSHGRYTDVFERREGVWKIAHRRIVQDGSRVELITDLAKKNPASAAQPWPEDPVYRGFAVTELGYEPAEAVPGRFAGLRAWGTSALEHETNHHHER